MKQTLKLSINYTTPPNINEVTVMKVRQQVKKRELKLWQEKLILKAKEYLETKIILAGGTISDMFERIQATINYAKLHGQLAPNISFPVMLDTRAMKDKHLLYGKFKDIYFIYYSMGDVEIQQPSHFSHTVFRQLYMRVMFLYYHHIVGYTKAHSEELSRKSLLHMQFKASFLTDINKKQLDECISHSEKIDSPIAATASNIFALQQKRLKDSMSFNNRGADLLRVLVAPVIEPTVVKSISNFNPLKDTNPEVKEKIQLSINPVKSDWQLICGVTSANSFTNLLQNVFERINEADLPSRHELTHKQFHIRHEQKEYGVIITPSWEDPRELLDLLLLQE